MTERFNGHFAVAGRGFPVLCIAGFGNSNWVFKGIAERLRDEFCLIMPDNRGMGRSPAASLPYLLDGLAADCLDLMDDLGHDRFMLTGLSMGGFIAQLLTLQAPERVTGLALLCSTSAGAAFQKVFPSMTREQVAAIYKLKAQARVEAALSPAVCPLLKPRYPEVYQYVLAERSAEQEDPAQVMMQFDAVSRFMEKPLPLTDILCPTLVMSGDTDPLVPIINAEMLVESIPFASLSVVPDTDHLFFLEKEAETGKRLREFFQACIQP